MKPTPSKRSHWELGVKKGYPRNERIHWLSSPHWSRPSHWWDGWGTPVRQNMITNTALIRERERLCLPEGETLTWRMPLITSCWLVTTDTVGDLGLESYTMCEVIDVNIVETLHMIAMWHKQQLCMHSVFVHAYHNYIIVISSKSDL